MTTLAILSVAFGLQLPRSSTGHVREKLARIDFAGAAMLVLSVFTLLLGLDRGGNVAWADRFTAAALAASAVFILAFAAVELRWAREPFAPKRIIANRALLASYLCNLFSSAAAITLVFHISLYLQAVRDASASDVGLILLPTIFGGVTGSLATGLIMQSTGQYYVLTIAVFTLMLIGNTTVALVTGAARYSLLGLIIGARIFQRYLFWGTNRLLQDPPQITSATARHCVSPTRPHVAYWRLFTHRFGHHEHARLAHRKRRPRRPGDRHRSFLPLPLARLRHRPLGRDYAHARLPAQEPSCAPLWRERR